MCWLPALLCLSLGAGVGELNVACSGASTVSIAACVQRQLSYRVTTPDRVTWQGVRAAWKEEPVFQAVGERDAEILFVRHITSLQMQAAEDKKAQAAEVRARFYALRGTVVV